MWDSRRENKMGSPTLLFEILTERPIVRNDSISELDIAVQIKRQGSSSLEEKRKPLNLCLVIDRSGSMEGQKLARAKQSCIDIYRRLDKDDLLTVVAFDDTSQVIINPATPKNEVERRIESIRPGNQTNIADGWSLGILELQKVRAAHYINRLILLSDGLITFGETRVGVLGRNSSRAREEGITTSTIGIGEEISEDILATIASSSNGRFWYIEKTGIETIIETEFSSYLSILIENPRVVFEFPEGVKIAKDLNAVEKKAGKYFIRPVVSAYNFAVRLKVEPALIDANSVVLKAVLYDESASVSEAYKEILVRPPQEYVVSPENPIVKSIVQQYESSKVDELMIEKMDAGDLDFDFMKKALLKEINTIRQVKGSLEKEEEKEEISREIDYLEKNLQENEDISVVIDLLAIMRQLLSERVFGLRIKAFLTRWRKIVMHRMHDKRGRHYGHALDQDLQASLLEEALGIADDLARDFPSRKDVLEIREKMYAQVARYQ
jgi:Ca-activated chloride channel homolog